jgi:uncharacterized protein YecT (DUF1311 family)
MHKSLAALLLAPLLLACSKEPPKCSDPATVSLLKDIVFDKLNLDTGAREKIGVQLLDSLLGVDNARPSAYDEKIKKFSCEATLVAKGNGDKGDSYSLPVQYESQLDDKNNHIVALKGVLVADLRQVDLYLATGIENAKKKAGGGTEGAAALAQAPAAQPAQEQSPSPAQGDVAPAAASEQASTVEQSGICKGLDLSITVDQAECTGRRFTLADNKLNDDYKRVMASLSSDRQAELKNSQLAWIKEKETRCAEAGKEVEGGTLEPIVITDCQVKMTEERTTFLQNYR